jgi:CheY-like chemotaxis protein
MAAMKADLSSEPSPTLAADTLTPGARIGPTVLLVDDERSFRFQMRELLEDEGFNVVGEASDGLEAVEVAQLVRPAVILMDIRMPNLGGIEATGRIKEFLPETQVIIFSAYDDPARSRGADDVGAYCYLVKGCRPQLITDMLLQAWICWRGIVEAAPAEGSVRGMLPRPAPPTSASQ